MYPAGSHAQGLDDALVQEISLPGVYRVLSSINCLKIEINLKLTSKRFPSRSSMKSSDLRKWKRCRFPFKTVRNQLSGRSFRQDFLFLGRIYAG